jgi:5-methylcytosine-specific restriction protein A
MRSARFRSASRHGYPDRRKDAVGVLYFREVTTDQTELVPTLELLEFRATEGKKRLVAHFKRERRADLTLAKRNEIRAKHGWLICEACACAEKDFPDSIGEACFEVHHKAPLSGVADETETCLADLAMLCANCHRMIHRSEPMPTVEAFKRVLVK